MSQNKTFRELLEEIHGGFSIYVPVLISLNPPDEHIFEEVTQQTSIMENPVGWSDKLTHEYGGEPYVLVGENDYEGGLDTPVSIGRSRQCQICLEHESISKVHATIAFVRQKGAYFVVDHDSKNGTHLNGESLIARLRTPLWSGAFLSFGDSAFVFFDPPSLRSFARQYG